MMPCIRLPEAAGAAERVLLGWEGLCGMLSAALLRPESASLGTRGTSRTAPPCWRLPGAAGNAEVRGRPQGGVLEPLLPSDERRLPGCDKLGPSGSMPASG